MEKKKTTGGRRSRAVKIRKVAADSLPAPFPKHKNNDEENDFDTFMDLSSYRKGLSHDPEGFVDKKDYDAFAAACNSLNLSRFEKLKIGTPDNKFRGWESPEAGAYYEINGSDAQAITMPPAPELGSDELAAEMAEVYLMALLRDEPFTNFDNAGCSKVQRAIAALNGMDWFKNGSSGRRQGVTVTESNLFRGTAEGDDKGPVISQFLLAGNPDIAMKPPKGRVDLSDEGMIEYGAQRIDQRVRFAVPKKDFMINFTDWRKVQNGSDIPNIDRGNFVFEKRKPIYRFITTPRDLATYVHFDALYQAYLNACLLLLAARFDFQKGFPYEGLTRTKGFAQFGGPHILTLVTEVATRALKAVRFQKFTNHRRARPEAIAGAISQYKSLGSDPNKNKYLKVKPLEELVNKLDAVKYGNTTLLEAVRKHNKSQGGQGYFLPMAFPEGSPMHPAYGAGHATVAGACVTILKAFFDTSQKIRQVYVPVARGARLRDLGSPKSLTVLGELHKLAANISIGRNMAGVHYFTDYYESIVLGEEIAIQMLQEQAYTYTEKVEMKIPRFFSGKVALIKSPPRGASLPMP